MRKINKKDTTDLMQYLVNRGIDISQWGKAQAKTIQHLQDEIESGEAILITDKKGNLLRRVVVGVAHIYYYAPTGKKFQLIEDRQVFIDGRIRRRNRKQAVSEKMKPGEDPMKATIRGIKEELSIKGKISLIKTGTEIQKTYTPSYPGRAIFLSHR